MIVVAVDNKYGIGKDGKIPWDVDLDHKVFYDITTRRPELEDGTLSNEKNVLIVGAKTWRSLPWRGFPKRITAVVSATLVQTEKDGDDVYFVRTINDAIKLAKRTDQVFFCGGTRIYEEAIVRGLAYRLYMTTIEGDFACDTFFPSGKAFGGTFNAYVSTPDKKLSFHEHGLVSRLTCGEANYLSLLMKILHRGECRQTRNGLVHTLIAQKLRFDLSKGFPLYTTKRIFWKGVVAELQFFLAGETNTKKLEDAGVNIWKKNTSSEAVAARGLDYAEGDMGPMYGFNWRHFGATYTNCNDDYTDHGVDQIKRCLSLIKSNPFARDIMMTTFDPSNVHQGVLPPCHGIVVQFDVSTSWTLSATVYIRSNDMCCGNPFNVASYALLIHFFVYAVNYDPAYNGEKLSPGMLNLFIGNAHIYENHIDNAIRQCMREPYEFPTLSIRAPSVDRAGEFPLTEDIELLNYNSYPPLKYELNA